MNDADLIMAGITINGTGPLWTPRIIDAAVAQALAEAGLHDLGRPLPTTSNCRTVAAIAETTQPATPTKNY